MKKNAGVKKEEVTSYLKASRGLERDLLTEVVRSKKIAWRVAGGFFVIAVVASIGAAWAYQRPVPDPVVLGYDKATGAAEVLNTANTEIKTLGNVQDEYWIRKYINNREQYDYWNIQTYYNTTRLLSAPDVQRQYRDEYYPPQNGRDARYGDDARIDVNIRSIQPSASENQAIVRFSTQVVHTSGEREPREYYIVTMHYSYHPNRTMSRSERWDNPYGFTVNNYRRDLESVPE